MTIKGNKRGPRASGSWAENKPKPKLEFRVPKKQVDVWLANQRARELPILESVNIWSLQEQYKRNDERGKLHKGSFYFPATVLAEMLAAAEEGRTSLSHIVQQAWHVARARIRQYPGKVDFK